MGILDVPPEGEESDPTSCTGNTLYGEKSGLAVCVHKLN